MKRTRRIVNIIFTIFAILLIAFIIFQKSKVSSYTISDFVGQTEEDVRSWADQNDVPSSSFVFADAYSSEDEGTIIAQSLEAGSSFQEGDVITFTVSKGLSPSTEIQLPDFTGETQGEIQQWCDDNGMTNVTFTTQDSDQAEGTFLAQDPASGTMVTQDTAITITLAHQTSVTLPDFTGQTMDEISTWCTANGITPNFIYTWSEAAYNTYVDSDVAAGTSVDIGSTINFYISSNAYAR